MILKDFYNEVIEKYKNGSYRIKYKSGILSAEITEDSFHTYALNYIIFEYCIVNNDPRWKELFDFLLIPIQENNKINLKDYDVDLSICDFEEFYDFMISIKN